MIESSRTFIDFVVYVCTYISTSLFWTHFDSSLTIRNGNTRLRNKHAVQIFQLIFVIAILDVDLFIVTIIVIIVMLSFFLRFVL